MPSSGDSVLLIAIKLKVIIEFMQSPFCRVAFYKKKKSRASVASTSEVRDSAMFLPLITYSMVQGIP